eukprot:6176456-Pleurochrysis_carterae.AAC.2
MQLASTSLSLIEPLKRAACAWNGPRHHEQQKNAQAGERSTRRGRSSASDEELRARRSGGVR